MITLSFGAAIALHYFVDDLPGATIPGARLQSILDCLQLGRQPSRLQIEFLQHQRLEALHQLAVGKLTYDSFRDLALNEQVIRTEVATSAKLAFEAAARVQEEAARERMETARRNAEDARRTRENDPHYIAKIKNKNLRNRYGIDTSDEPRYDDRLMSILIRMDAGQRMDDNDRMWLVANKYFSPALKNAYHKLEAAFFVSEFEKTSDPWAAASASKHYRKCDCAVEASSMLSNIDVEQLNPDKLKSVFCTTYGGVMRDLGKHSEALRLGLKAHASTPNNYQPCTLLGAIYMETGGYALGQEWYAKAIERGAKVDSLDQDILTIFSRADRARQIEMREFLLGENPIRFAWAKNA